MIARTITIALVIGLISIISFLLGVTEVTMIAKTVVITLVIVLVAIVSFLMGVVVGKLM